MKLRPDERANLHRLLAAALRERGLRYVDVSTKTGVDASQVSRICRGQFRTMSGNVMQICIALGVANGADADLPLPTADPKAADEREAAWARLEASVRRVWDQTPAGAAKLAAVMEALGRMRH